MAADLIRKKGHNDELSELICKAVYAITKKILVNWSRVFIYYMEHLKTKLFYGPSLTSLFEHFNVPLSNEPSLLVRTKNLDSVAIEKMEQALERTKTLKSMKSSHGASLKRPEEIEESSEEKEDQQNKEQIDNFRSQIADIKLQ